MTFILEVALIRDDDDRERILVFYPKNLLVEDTDFLKRVAGRNRVDEQESLSGPHVLFSHSTVRDGGW